MKLNLHTQSWQMERSIANGYCFIPTQVDNKPSGIPGLKLYIE